MIEALGLTVQFGGVRPLDALDARLGATIVGLIGPNGAGKTTFLNVVSGFVLPASGDVQLDGISLAGKSANQRVRMGLRRVFQQELIVNELSVHDNVMAIADHVCTDRREARKETMDALGFVGLADRRNLPAGRLNLFERRMLEIGKTLVGGPKVVLLDEPAAGLNEPETKRQQAVIAAMPAAFGLQIILVDHDADLIASTCVETLVLDFGVRLALGPTRAVLDDPTVRRAYLGKE